MCTKMIRYLVIIITLLFYSTSVYNQIPGNIDACFKGVECTDNLTAWDKTDWGNEIKSICRIVTKYQNGQVLDSAVHTGVLINNPNIDNSRINSTPIGDNTLYILSDYHSLINLVMI